MYPSFLKNILRTARKNMIVHILKPISNVLIKTGLIEKCALIRVDGGICSQMHFYMIGSYIKSKGYKVKYDITWFDNNGFDLLGKDKRVFDLQKAFTSLEFCKASRFEMFFYKPFIYYNDFYDEQKIDKWQSMVPPIYFQGYYKTPKGFYLQWINLFKMNDEFSDIRNKSLLDEIRHRNNSVAIHVRRGDLATYNSAYGDPVPISYFKIAADYISNVISSPYFYFFSDDAEWVKDVLIKSMQLNDNFQIVDINDATKGYLDLFLISACHHQITSKGSFGKYGAFLNKTNDNIIIIYDDYYERKAWEFEHPNIVFLKPGK